MARRASRGNSISGWVDTSLGCFWFRVSCPEGSDLVEHRIGLVNGSKEEGTMLKQHNRAAQLYDASALGVATVLLGVMAISAKYSSPPRPAYWQLIGSQGQIQFVLVPKSGRAEINVYEDARAALCEGRRFCYLLFWSDKRFVPQSLPMTDTQASHMTAKYTRNPDTGVDVFLWNCQINGEDRSSCF
jgi:hypothetical protein